MNFTLESSRFWRQGAKITEKADTFDKILIVDQDSGINLSHLF